MLPIDSAYEPMGVSCGFIMIFLIPLPLTRE